MPNADDEVAWSWRAMQAPWVSPDEMFDDSGKLVIEEREALKTTAQEMPGWFG
jgi:hypothetical protein